MAYDGQMVRDEFKEAFGFPVEQLSVRQLWILVKMMKNARLRCRNNSAMNNWLNRNFPGHSFSQVTKTRQDGSTYPGLQITNKSNPEDIVKENENEDD